jgi:hypothetical protein
MSGTAFFNLRSTLAKKYRSTYDEIKVSILKGSLIHIDETKVQVKGLSSGYVWVLTNMDSVFFLFRPNRKADFLTDLLAEFKGVLVSDFFSGYDSIPSPQQKCLIHLVRDLNDDLFENQFDDELKIVVAGFGKLLQNIVETINRYGLKKRYLSKHKKDVHLFYRELVNRNYGSDVAIKNQKRMQKYEDKLFCFLDYDGIPWNNNNAENAIKPFAAHRKNVDGNFTVRGIEQYLIFLSIQQTCRFRGVRLLDFLRSGETSLDDLGMRS